MIDVGRIVCIGPSKTPPSFSPRHPLDMQTVQNPLFRQFPTIYWFFVNLTPLKTTFLSLNISDFSIFYLKTELPLKNKKNHPRFPSNPPLTMGGHPKNKTLLKWELRYSYPLCIFPGVRMVCRLHWITGGMGTEWISLFKACGGDELEETYIWMFLCDIL